MNAGILTRTRFRRPRCLTYSPFSTGAGVTVALATSFCFPSRTAKTSDSETIRFRPGRGDSPFGNVARTIPFR